MPHTTKPEATAAPNAACGRLDPLVRRKRVLIGRWLIHVLVSQHGSWTVTKASKDGTTERYSLWLYFGPLDRHEGRAWILTIYRWQLMFARA